MKTCVLAISLFGLLLSGCTIVGDNSDFDSQGLPKKEFYVGGGFAFNYTPTQAGTLYLVEKNTRTLVLTQSMAANENLTESIDVTDEHIIKNLEALGIDTNNMVFSIYFIPAAKTDTN